MTIGDELLGGAQTVLLEIHGRELTYNDTQKVTGLVEEGTMIEGEFILGADPRDAAQIHILRADDPRLDHSQEIVDTTLTWTVLRKTDNPSDVCVVYTCKRQN